MIIKKHLYHALSFLLGLVLLLTVVSYAFLPKGNGANSGLINPTARGFLAEPENSLDIVMVGNSDAYSGYSPGVMYSLTGSTGYVSGEGRQNTAETLAMLKLIFENQSPKVVLLECDNVFDSFSLPVQLVKAACAKGPLSIFTYHDRWRDMDISSLFSKVRYNHVVSDKGQWVSSEVVPYTGKEYLKSSNRTARIPAESLQCIKEIQELCQKHDAMLVLVQLPSASSYSTLRRNALLKLASDLDVPFFDLDYTRQSYGFNWATDTRDGGNHLNCSGATKTTREIARLLSTITTLPDHRGKKGYSAWDKLFSSCNQA